MSPSAFNDADYEALTAEQKYRVSNNLAASLFNGVANEDQLDLLGSTVVGCTDFYTVVSEHPDLIPSIAKRLVDVFLAGASDEKKDELVTVALETDPGTRVHRSRRQPSQRQRR